MIDAVSASESHSSNTSLSKAVFRLLITAVLNQIVKLYASHSSSLGRETFDSS